MLCAFAGGLLPGRLDAQAAPATTSADGPALPTTDYSHTSSPAPQPLIDNDAILRMAKAGLSETILLQTVQLQPGHYDTSPDALIALNAAGVPQTVISAMQRAGTGLHTRPPVARPLTDPSSSPLTDQPIDRPTIPQPSPAVDPAPLAPGIDDLGVYYKDAAGLWQPMHLERVVFKSAGAAKNVLTHGIISKDMNGYVDGPSSPLVLHAGQTILIYAPTGTEGAEYSFLQFREKPDHREFRVLYGGVFHSESGTRRDEITFTPTRIGPHMFTFPVPADVVKGQYGVLPPGAANQRSLADSGKVYTFAVAE